MAAIMKPFDIVHFYFDIRVMYQKEYNRTEFRRFRDKFSFEELCSIYERIFLMNSSENFLIQKTEFILATKKKSGTIQVGLNFVFFFVLFMFYEYRIRKN